MAHIKKLPFASHLRSEPSRHLIHYKNGRRVQSGRGLAFWFFPLKSSVAEVPCDDRDLSFLFHGRSSDYQDVTVQGVLTYRVADPEALANRIDFWIDLETGLYAEEPLEQLSELLTKKAQQFAYESFVSRPVREILSAGVDPIRRRIEEGLVDGGVLAGMGVEVVSVDVASVAPTADLEKALEVPTLETIQQLADEAMFKRRALAVEKERAIQENELQNNIELAIREEQLIERRGQNERRRATEEAEARRIEAEAAAGRSRLESAARADGLRSVEEARVESERERIDVYRDLAPHVLVGMAAKEFAGKLQKIDHLNLTPDLLGPLLGDLVQTGRDLVAGRKGASGSDSK